MKILVVIIHFAGDISRKPEDDLRYNRYGIPEGQQYIHESELDILLTEYNSWPENITIYLQTTQNINISNYKNLKIIQNTYPVEIGWRLPITYRQIMINNQNNYDCFIYSENDLLLTYKNLQTYLNLSKTCSGDLLPGFIRYELKPNDPEKYLLDFHLQWKRDNGVASWITSDLFTIYNLHQGIFILTKKQLKKAISSGGFTTEFLWNSAGWDKAARCVTDLYTKCGFTKVISKFYLDDLLIHHLTDSYCTRSEMPWNDILTLTELKKVL